jgi:hypothetical protein
MRNVVGACALVAVIGLVVVAVRRRSASQASRVDAPVHMSVGSHAPSVEVPVDDAAEA